MRKKPVLRPGGGPGSPPCPASSSAHPTPGVQGAQHAIPTLQSQGPVPEPDQARLSAERLPSHPQDVAGRGLLALALQEAFQLLPQGLPLLLESRIIFSLF